MTLISAEEAGRRLYSGGEVAFLDLREAGQFGEAHPLFAVPAPWSQLELVIGTLVPRRTVPVILLDAGDGISLRAAARLTQAGYTDVSVIDGGVEAWQAAGFGLFKGVNVPSKTLGEMAEQVWHPPMLTPADLAAWRREAKPFALFDARPPVEYAKMRVPGAVCLPNGELAHRIAAIPAAGSLPVVVCCAGRTRGIIGAVGLQLSGHQGAVYALENGTQGWALAGEVLERGNTADAYPQLDDAGLAASVAAADRLIARFAIPQTTPDALRALLADPSRTTYLLDTRSAAEAKAYPVPGAVNAKGGQLVQATDQWVGVRRARLVLCCDSGLRSALAAFWLRQLGYDAQVMRIDDDLRRLDLPAPQVVPVPQVPGITAAAALAQLHRPRLPAEKVLLLDLRGSQAFRKRHVPGATWVVRPALYRLIDQARAAGQVLLLADDAGIASLVAADLHEAGVTRVALVEGGLAALTQAGAALESTPSIPVDEDAIDHLLFVHDRHDGNLESSRRYLAWETGLLAQLSAAERAEFHLRTPDNPVHG